MNQPIHSQKFSISDILKSLGDGWHLFLAIPKISIAYTSIFAVIGLILFGIIGLIGVSPMTLPFAGGFMLIGPVLLSGFFKVADLYHDNKQTVGLSVAVLALKSAPRQLWIVSLVCFLLFLIWITDAAILYVIMIGGEHMPFLLPWGFELKSNVIAFEFWGAVMGSVIAFLIFSVSAFSVPLLYQSRVNLVSAVTLSIKTVFGNFISSIAWGICLSALMIVSILILPLFIVALPVLAFASYSLYSTVFPETARAPEE